MLFSVQTSLLFLEFSIIYKLNFKFWTSFFINFSDYLRFCGYRTEHRVQFDCLRCKVFKVICFV